MNRKWHKLIEAVFILVVTEAIVIGSTHKTRLQALFAPVETEQPAVASDRQSKGAYASEEKVTEKLETIRRSFEKQRAMFKNMRFKSNWLQPHTQIKQEPGKPPQEVEFINIPDEKILNIQEYQTDKNGKYLLSLEQYVTDAASGEIKSKRHSEKYSFNGETYRVFYSEKQASIFTSKQRFSTGRSLIKPTSYMDHMFNENVDWIFDNPQSANFSETANGLWVLEYRNDESEEAYNITLDPKKDYMIVELKRTSKAGDVYEKKIEYRKTKEGFWYPARGHMSFSSQPDLTMNITEFELNVPDTDYTLDFPKGTHVRDYTKDPEKPEIYRYGQPRKSYEEIIRSGNKFVAGFVTDENGSAVAGVPVQVCCHKKTGADGRFSFTLFGGFDVLNTITDSQGLFAIELEEDGAYNLRFAPKNHADIIAYDVPVGKSDLKVTLPEGGTVTGRVVRIENDRKVPLASVEVKAEQSDRSAYSSLGFGRYRKTVTDPQGRFQFNHLRTKRRDFGTAGLKEWQYTPRAWKISYGKTSKTVVFYEGAKIDDVELIVEPDYTSPISLIGKPLPGFEGLGLEIKPEQTKDKMILVCFFDMNQRPSRRCIMELAKQADQLKQKGVIVIALQAFKVDENALNEWVKKQNILFLVGMIEGDAEKMRFVWGVRSLPWLILTDKEHAVRAEGFALEQLDEKIKQAGDR